MLREFAQSSHFATRDGLFGLLDFLITLLETTFQFALILDGVRSMSDCLASESKVRVLAAAAVGLVDGLDD